MANEIIDFKMNDRGDLVLEETVKNNKFNILFNVAANSVFRLNFNCNPPQIKSKKLSSSFHINFTTNNNNDSAAQYSAATVSGLEEVAQLISIRLKTSEEESGRDSLNTTLQKLKHTMFVDSTDLFSKIESLIVDKISDIVDTPTVIAEYKKGTGNFYCQNVSVSIYNKDNNLVYEYIV